MPVPGIVQNKAKITISNRRKTTIRCQLLVVFQSLHTKRQKFFPKIQHKRDFNSFSFHVALRISFTKKKFRMELRGLCVRFVNPTRSIELLAACFANWLLYIFGTSETYTLCCSEIRPGIPHTVHSNAGDLADWRWT